MARIIRGPSTVVSSGELAPGTYGDLIVTDAANDTVSGLAPGTFYEFVVSDPSGALIVTGAPSLTPTFLVDSGATPSKSGAVLTYEAALDYATAGITAGDRLVIFTHFNSSLRTAASGTFGANAMTLARPQDTSQSEKINIWTVTAPSGTSAALTVTLDSATGGISAGAYAIYKISAAPSSTIVGGVAASSTSSQSFTMNVYDGGAAIVAYCDVRASDTVVVVGVGNQRTINIAGNSPNAQIRHGFSTFTADEISPPRTFTGTLAGNGLIVGAGISFEA